MSKCGIDCVDVKNDRGSHTQAERCSTIALAIISLRERRSLGVQKHRFKVALHRKNELAREVLGCC